PDRPPSSRSRSRRAASPACEGLLCRALGRSQGAGKTRRPVRTPPDRSTTGLRLCMMRRRRGGNHDGESVGHAIRTGMGLALLPSGANGALPVKNVRPVMWSVILVALVAFAIPGRLHAQSRDLDSYLLFALSGIRTKGITMSGPGNIGVNDPNGSIYA